MDTRFYYDECAEEIFDSKIEDYPATSDICSILNKQEVTIKKYKEEVKKLNFGIVHLKNQLKQEKENKVILKNSCEILIDDSIHFLKENEQIKSGQNQKAIECLKEVRRELFGTPETGIVFNLPKVQDTFYAIDNKIKELEGNNE